MLDIIALQNLLKKSFKISEKSSNSTSKKLQKKTLKTLPNF